ncbi:hypothetical protein [Arsukibacterium perlucidum]|uniref:hypothetical protein n=1 Tax=Arsukibacterium perlucidum TaxID=368811 RepID=UPI000363BC8D|nr:hypothetical protein [Arsukibacterium perlucidum]
MSSRPNRTATDRTFGLVDIWQLLRKLYWEMEILASVQKSYLPQEKNSIFNFKDVKSYASINVASTNVSLIEWLFYRLDSDDNLKQAFISFYPLVDLNNPAKFSNSLRSFKVELQICHQVCNANKHFKLQKGFDNNVSAMTFDIVKVDYEDEKKVLEIHTVHDFSFVRHCSMRGYENQTLFPKDIFIELLKWWTSLLKSISIPDQTIYFPELDAWQDSLPAI